MSTQEVLIQTPENNQGVNIGGVFKRLSRILALCGILLLAGCLDDDNYSLPTVAATAFAIPAQAAATPDVPLAVTAETSAVEGRASALVFNPFAEIISRYIDPAGNLTQSVPYDELKGEVEGLLRSEDYGDYMEQVEQNSPPEVRTSLLLLNLMDGNDNVVGLCSGVNLGYHESTNSYYVFTAAHCVTNLGEALVDHPEGEGHFKRGNYLFERILFNQPHLDSGFLTSPTELEGNTLFDPRSDLAMIRIPADKVFNGATWPQLKIGTASDQVYVNGYPYFAGIPYIGQYPPVNHVSIPDQGASFIQLGNLGVVWPGMSGGGVYDKDGQLIGILNRIADTTGLNPGAIFTAITPELLNNLQVQLIQ